MCNNFKLSEVISQVLGPKISKILDKDIVGNVEEFFEQVRDNLVGEKRYGRGSQYYRWDYRKRKFFETVFGTTNSFKLPRIRKKCGNEVSFIEKHERRSIKLTEFIFLMFFGSSSLRGIRSLLKKTYGIKLSFPGISTIVKKYRKKLSAKYKRKLLDEYIAIVVDGIYFTIRGSRKLHVRKRKHGIIFAIGIKRSGSHEVLDYELTKGEGTEDYLKMFKRLYERGVKNPEIIVGDNCHGIWEAVSYVYPYAREQKCSYHILRNCIKELRFKDLEYIANFRGDYWYCFSTVNYDVFSSRFEDFKRKYASETEVLKILDRNFPYMGNHLKLNWKLRQKLRTTNLAEGFFSNMRNFTGRFPGFVSEIHALDAVNVYLMGTKLADWRLS